MLEIAAHIVFRAAGQETTWNDRQAPGKGLVLRPKLIMLDYTLDMKWQV